jgi:hypothetical protein
MHEIYFSMIKIEGYRGRNFTLKMNPMGENTVFKMDGNTGKTTTIELLRWCFGHSQHEAEKSNMFKHMWTNPSYVLDDTKKGTQKCEIIIQFSATGDDNQKHFFTFKRETQGEHIENYPPVNEKITKIYDTLEIDRGKDVLIGNDVFSYMSQEFRFNECEEYFCFDGEKARDIMQLASNSKNIKELLELVNRRTTHPKLREYKQKLETLRERVLDEAKSKISDKALEVNVTRRDNRRKELTQLDREIEGKDQERRACTLALDRLTDEHHRADQQITTAKSQELVERTRYELIKEQKKKSLNERRAEIYEHFPDWISANISDQINGIKKMVKEKGKLPEPYRRDLIESCLTSGFCDICGRPLDKEAEERVKSLELQMAPYGVHDFLSLTFSLPLMTFPSDSKYSAIKKLIEEYNIADTRLESIKLSDDDEKLISERDTLLERIGIMQRKISNIERDIQEQKEWRIKLVSEINELEAKIILLSENKVILDKINESIQIIDNAAENIKLKATEIISNVISEGVTSILGPKFSAKLSQKEGLMLGENGFFGKEKGGYSGRLVLSYCFAEAMTMVEPIIVDTPAGNIGDARKKLAEHLVANHRQVILLCLPTELENFASIVSTREPTEVINLEM